MANIFQRPLKGSRRSTFYPVKALPALSALDTAFQFQEFISLTIRYNIHDVSTIISIPSSWTNTEGVDEARWVYQQLRYVIFDASAQSTRNLPSLRRLVQDLSHPLITVLQQECTRATCPEMKAGVWMYLCIAHGDDGGSEASPVIFSSTEKKAMSLTETAAMLRHRLHFAHRRQRVDAPQLIRGIPITVRTTREHLPFSLVPLTSPHRTNIPFPARQHFGSLARRLGRIFAHAYFHHREVFEQAEAESSLYARFLALSYKYDLVPPEFLVIGRPEFEASRLAALHREEFTLVISVG